MEISRGILDSFSLHKISQDELFDGLFSAECLFEAFESKFRKSQAKGVDRLAGPQYQEIAPGDLVVVATKCAKGTFRFSPYLETLKPKGREKYPRVIGVPTIRDRVILCQMNLFLAAIFGDCVPKNIASTYVRQISSDIRNFDPCDTWVCGTDIRNFYDSLKRERLLNVVSKRVSCSRFIGILARAIITPIVPINTKRKKRREFQSELGVPQGLAISNILAMIYMQDVDSAMRGLGVAYYRYVDDVLMYGEKVDVESGFKSLQARLRYRGLKLHPLGSSKTTMGSLSTSFSYLGYVFDVPKITVRDATIERFLQGIAAKFSSFRYESARKVPRFPHLTRDLARDVFILELNEKITGAISENRRYGWISYFNEITDLTLLSKIDATVASMFRRMPEFGFKAPRSLKRVMRAYFEMKFRPRDGYVHNYDKIVTQAHKFKFLVERGRVAATDELGVDDINEKFDSYRRRVLKDMHSDEGVVY